MTARERRTADRRREARGHLVVLGPPGPHPAVIEVLEDALDAARRGHVTGVALAIATSDRCEATAYARGDAPLSTLISATTRLQGRLLVHEDDGWGGR